MADRPEPDEVKKWHKWFAIECNNSAWDLVEKESRTAEEDREMVGLAYASTLHWSRVGAPVNAMRGDLLLARVHSLLGHLEQASNHASRALQFCLANACEPWDFAFAHGEMAYAAAINGDAATHAKHYRIAKEAGEALKDEEDRKAFLTSLNRIPKL